MCVGPVVTVSVNETCTKLDKIGENVESAQNDRISQNDREALTLLNAIRPIHSVQVTLRKPFKPFKKSAQMSPRAKKKRGRLDEAEMEKGYPAVVWCAR